MSPYSMFGGNPILNSDVLLDSPRVVGGHLVGYTVEKGQGPLAIAGDINNPETQKKYGYTTLRKVDFRDIVNENPQFFGNVKDKADPSDNGYSNLNMHVGDNLSLVKFTGGNLIRRLEGFNSSLQAANNKLSDELDLVTKDYNKAVGEYNTRTQQGKAMGGDPRSGADVATYLNTSDIRKKVKTLNKQKQQLERKISTNNQQIQQNKSTIKTIKTISGSN